MRLTINGEPRDVAAVATVADLLAWLRYQPGSVAVARNGQFVPRGSYAQTAVQEGDDLEFVAPMQGG